MNTTPTAEEFLLSKMSAPDLKLYVPELIAFAKLHAQAALEAAGNVADSWENSGELKPEIINSYDINDIK